MTSPIIELAPSELIEAAFHVDMDLPFKFEGREYLRPIYDNQDKIMVLYFGRQSEKSTTLANKMLMYSIAYRRFRTLYVSPADTQTKEFSMDKVDPKLRYSPYIMENFWGETPPIDNVYLKEMRNGSRMVFRSAYKNPDRIRGISADMLCVDECQDVNPDFLPVIEECISHSQHRFRLYAGTPDMHMDALDQVWGYSDQTEYVFKCPKGHWNRQDFEIVERISKDGVHCKSCGEIIIRASGQWVVTNKEGRYKGYRTSQLMVPWLDGDDIIDKLERYPTKRFLNEVVALPYESSAAPVAERHLKACCDEKVRMIRYGVSPSVGSPVFAGIDWGTGLKSYTMLCFVAHLAGKWTVLRAKRFTGIETDANVQMKLIMEELGRFNPISVACDWGFGFLQNAQVKLKYQHGDVKTVFSSSQSSPASYDRVSDRFTINRSYMMSRMFNMILQEQIRFPAWEDFATFGKDILTIRAEDPDESTAATKQLKYVRVGPDDFFHAMMYALMIGEITTGRLVIDVV